MPVFSVIQRTGTGRDITVVQLPANTTGTDPVCPEAGLSETQTHSDLLRYFPKLESCANWRDFKQEQQERPEGEE